MKRRLQRDASRVLLVLALPLVGLFATMTGRAMQSVDAPAPREPLALDVPAAHAAEGLADYVRVDSSDPERPRSAETIRLLVERYVEPLGLEHEVFEDRILLVRWRAGTEEARAEGGPLLFTSHADVVPVADDERGAWTHPPFAGAIDDGYVWGRGALDMKSATIAQLEAIAALQRAGIRPRRDVFLLVSPDEESGGHRGAGAMVERHFDALEDPWAVLDEGSFAVPDHTPGRLLVPVGVTEKRYVTLRLSVAGASGHSSTPHDDAAAAVLVRALARIEATDQPTEVGPVTDAFLDRVADAMAFWPRLALRNRWLLGPVIEARLAARPGPRGMLQDTVALTGLDAGDAENVVPSRARATLNLRLLPSSDLDAVIARLEDAVDDPRVRFEVLVDEGASPVAPTEGPRWEGLEAALRTAYDGREGADPVVAPMITPATTDARWFARRGIPTYRFVPFVVDAGERSRLHGIDERISVANLADAARVYAHLMRYW